MDPFLNSLAHKLLAETLAESDQDRERTSEWGKNLRQQLGILLVMLGQKLQANELETKMAFEDDGYCAC